MWTVADRRLTDNKGRVVREDARKIMFLETTDGVAILAYAGLGSTARGTEPSDWMSAVLRGRNWTLEQSLDTLANALKREMPSHLNGLRVQAGTSHNVLISAFVNNEPRVYTIDLALSPDRQRSTFRCTRWIVSTKDLPPRTPNFGLAGSGTVVLARDTSWRRHVLGLVNAYDRHRITAKTVADALAAVNHRVSLALADGTVGPKCIVAWRNRRTGVHKDGGGHQAFTGTARDQDTHSLPTISNGMDTHAILAALMPHSRKHLAALLAGNADAQLDTDAANADLAQLPETPDEKLR